MAVVEVSQVTHRYGKVTALENLDLAVPQGALYALLGPNGSGKTTLLQILMGLRRPAAGRVMLFGKESGSLSLQERAAIGYIAEGQSLPGWMRLEQLETYLAPLYSTWDSALADTLRDRFSLDPRRKLNALSRGEQMKAALLCALAPRPRLLIMDEPFTGMDALVKDELVRGLLDSASSEGWTVLLTSHDIGELEMLADWVGFLAGGRMQLSEPMESLKQRLRHVEIVSDAPPNAALSVLSVIAFERAGSRTSALVDHSGPQSLEAMLRNRLPNTASVVVREATLREIFVAFSKRAARNNGQRAA